MTLTASLGMALSALKAHAGRSLLTSLGIVIGIAAVIALVAAGDGAREKLDERLASLGKTMILVRAGVRTDQGAIADFTPLNPGDVAAIRRAAGPLVTSVAEVQMTNKLAVTRHGTWPVMVVGSTPEVQTIRNWQVARGRFYNADDMRSGAAVCLLGQTVRDKLFPQGAEVVGQTIRIAGQQFRVIGVAAAKGRSATGADQDDQVFMPITTVQKKLAGEEKVNLILVSARDEAALKPAQEAIRNAMRVRHRLKPGDPADFDVSSVQELSELAVVVTATLQGLSAVIASISLLVGGVGVMNIMLVSVTERTREIGLRMALGAPASAVLAQFLLEAVFLTLVGGVIGLALGLVFAGGMANALGWPLVIRPAGVVAACATAASVGLFFGFYPAWRASRLNPIAALRHE
ncbi:MAG: ABC transporter permease [Gemmataceae bacterium]|nr:ABC transporter permease [Gemmataceae bacterium]